MPRRSSRSPSKNDRFAKSKIGVRASNSDVPSALVSAILLSLCIGAVYATVFDVPFIFDDKASVINNESIRYLSPLIGSHDRRGPLNPPPDVPTVARPLVNLSFAISYHFAGLKPNAFHAANLVLHFVSACLVFAIIRRALLQPLFAGAL